MDDIRDRLDVAIGNFVSATAALKAAPTQDAAEEACLNCREAVQMFFFARGDLGEKATAKTDHLVTALDEAETALKVLANDSAESSVVWQYLENVQRRKDLVDALIHADVAKIKRILKAGLHAVRSH